MEYFFKVYNHCLYEFLKLWQFWDTENPLIVKFPSMPTCRYFVRVYGPGYAATLARAQDVSQLFVKIFWGFGTKCNTLYCTKPYWKYHAWCLRTTVVKPEVMPLSFTISKALCRTPPHIKAGPIVFMAKCDCKQHSMHIASRSIWAALLTQHASSLPYKLSPPAPSALFQSQHLSSPPLIEQIHWNLFCHIASVPACFRVFAI